MTGDEYLRGVLGRYAVSRGAGSGGASLRDTYYGLRDYLGKRGFFPRTQSVSIGLDMEGVWVDLVPGRPQAGVGGTTVCIFVVVIHGRRRTFGLTSGWWLSRAGWRRSG